jgi:hypothetical protein
MQASGLVPRLAPVVDAGRARLGAVGERLQEIEPSTIRNVYGPDARNRDPTNRKIVSKKLEGFWSIELERGRDVPLRSSCAY